MEILLNKLKTHLENIDSYRDRALFLFIKPCWPRAITPNHITYLRVLIGIGLFVILFLFGIEDKLLIIALFCAGAVTDFIDGPVARGLNKVTEFGAMLDSTADRILIIPIAVYSLFPMHKWLLLVLILAEIVNALTAIYYKSREIYLESNIFGKIKMVMQSLVFVAILVAWPKDPDLIFIYMLWLTIPLTFLSIFLRLKTIMPAYET